MKRRDFIKTSCLSAGALFTTNLLANVSKNGKKPNLLVIMTDEHNFRTLGCYRDTLSPEQAFMWGKGNIVETPAIDSLAKAGALCTNFYSTSPVCSPSRGSFMSGMFPQHTPVMKNDIPLKDEMMTFATLLQKEGYITGYSGKWHLDGHGKPQWGPKRQFGFADNRYMFNRGHWKVLEITADGPRVKTTKNGKPSYDITGADEESFTTDWLTNVTLDFIKEHQHKPFCYMVSYPDPHGPDKVRAPYDKMYTHMNFTKARTSGKSAKDAPSWAKPKSGGANQSQYYGMIKCIDDNIQRLVDYLKKIGQLDNTMIVFTSDHGDMRGEHDRQNKGTVLEASAKIPFIVRYPDKIDSGKIINNTFGCVDFMPTVLGLMGVNCRHTDGRNAAKLFTGNADGEQDLTIARGTGTSNWVSAITTRYKLVLSPEDQPWLIDKQNDPDELKNFCTDSKHRQAVKQLGQELLAYHKKNNDPSLAGEKLQYDLQWAVSDQLEYDSDKAPKVAAVDKPGKKKKAGKKNKK